MKQLFSVYDEKAGIHHQPQLLDSVDRAKWALAHSLASLADESQEPHPWTEFSSDYSLYSLGSFDEKTGTLEHNRVLICSLFEIDCVVQQIIGNSNETSEA